MARFLLRPNSVSSLAMRYNFQRVLIHTIDCALAALSRCNDHFDVPRQSSLIAGSDAFNCWFRPVLGHVEKADVRRR